MELKRAFTKQSVAIVGANGYSGIELARLLLRHPRAELKACFVRDPQWQLSHELSDKRAERVPTQNLESLISLAPHLDAVFLATPIEVSLELVPLLVAKTLVIDLSGAFRFSAHYGLMPWNAMPWNAMPWNTMPWKSGAQGSLVANPGCYSTSCLMALIPLLKARLIDPSAIVIDAKSGTTGAGRKAKENLLFSEVEGECLPYKIGTHPHLPEIKKYADLFSGADTDIQFTTHLLPVRRGILSSIYLKRSSDFILESDEKFLSRMSTAFESAYFKESLVRYGPVDTDPCLLSLKRVVGSPRTHISYSVQGNKISVFSCIDNLLKGAASQAIENWNSLNSWATDLGLEEPYEEIL